MSQTAAGTVFRLRTPAHIKSCHMTGSWDNYGKRYSMKPDSAAGPGWWTLTLKFGSSMGTGRFWYYYILDGYFESHDPNQPTCKEPTRNITLNILDILERPSSATSSPVSPSKRSGGVFNDIEIAGHSRSSSKCSSHSRTRTPSPRRRNAELPHLVHPKPRNPMGAHKLTLNTDVQRYTVITNAATTCGSEPSSAGSSRSASSCSSCSSGSPTTPMCGCDFHDDCECDEDVYSDDECYDSEEDIRAYKYTAETRRKAQVDGDDLAYHLERSLRV